MAWGEIVTYWYGDSEGIPLVVAMTLADRGTSAWSDRSWKINHLTVDSPGNPTPRSPEAKNIKVEAKHSMQEGPSFEKLQH